MGLRVGGGTEETSNSTSHSALGDYPTGEKGEEKKDGKKEKEEAVQRGSENENNIPVPPDFFSL